MKIMPEEIDEKALEKARSVFLASNAYSSPFSDISVSIARSIQAYRDALPDAPDPKFVLPPEVYFYKGKRILDLSEDEKAEALKEYLAEPDWHQLPFFPIEYLRPAPEDANDEWTDPAEEFDARSKYEDDPVTGVPMMKVMK